MMAALVLLAFSALASGQALRGSYFFETSLMRSKLNPAFAPQNNYISIPILGNIGVDAYSNVGLGNFIFPTSGTGLTFMNGHVPADTFLNKLPSKDPFIKERVETDVLGAGFRLGEGGFMTVALSVVENADVVIPNELLRFAKLGRTADVHSYNISGLGAKVGSYAQLSIGYSFDMDGFVEGLSFGGRVKLLAGLAAADVNLSKLSVQMEDDKFAVSTAGEGYLAGFTYSEADGFGARKVGFNGFGAAIDLGVEYRLELESFIDGLNFSASVTDLGFLGFNSNVTRLTSSGSAQFTGFQGIDADYDFQKNFENVLNDFKDLADFKASSADKYRYKLQPSIYAGVEAPFLDEMMSVGLLYYYTKGFSNVMASYNLSPIRWFNLGVNYTFLGPARTFGLYLEFIPKKVVGLFAGFNLATFKTNSAGIGIKNMTESACLGLNVVFGGE